MNSLSSSIQNGLAQMKYMSQDIFSTVQVIDASGEARIFDKKFDLTKSDDMEELYKTFYQLSWFTYRKNFSALDPVSGGLHTDAGWGCMLRTAQMLLAETLTRHYKLRPAVVMKSIHQSDTTYNDEEKRTLSLSSNLQGHKLLIKSFADAPKFFAHFSIHRMCAVGKGLNLNVGEWYGPRSASHVLQQLVESDTQSSKDFNSSNGIQAIVFDDGVIYKDVVKNSTSNWRDSVLFLMAVRIGLNSINQEYLKSLFACLKMKQSVGALGGKPGSARYLVGSRNKNFLVLDPHTVQPALAVASDPTGRKEISVSDLSTYHCSEVQVMSVNELDPSLSIGFYISSEADFDDFCKSIEEMNKDNKAVLLSVAEKKPTYTATGQRETQDECKQNDEIAVKRMESIDSDDDDFIVL